MLKYAILALFLIAAIGFAACLGPRQSTDTRAAATTAPGMQAPAPASPSAAKETAMDEMSDKAMTRTDEEWKKVLTDKEYRVLRCSATEPAFTGKYYNHKEPGVYRCAGCGNPLFSSDDKYDSGSGWPSYTRPVGDGAVSTQEDNSLFMTRTEVLCSRCGGHLGHVFEDGPNPTGLRYCINSAALQHEPDEGK